MVLATRCNSPLRVTDCFVVTRCFANRSQISGSRLSPNLDRYLLNSQRILRTAIKGVSAPARSLTRAFIVRHSDPWTLPPEHCSLTCESPRNMLKQTKKRICVCATEYMQSTTLLWAFRADDVSPVKIRPVFSPLCGGCYFNGTVSPSWSYFATVQGSHPFPGPGAKGNRGWVNQRTGSPHWKKKRLWGTHASMCIFSSWKRAGHPNRIVFQLARKGPWPDVRKVFVSAQALQEGICICNMVMSFFSYTGWTGN